MLILSTAILLSRVGSTGIRNDDMELKVND
jgi:hypothetical protein